MSNEKVDYPVEKYFPIRNTSDLLLRLFIGIDGNYFWVESDIVSSEGKKIVHHLGSKYKIADYFDAVQAGLDFYTKYRF